MIASNTIVINLCTGQNKLFITLYPIRHRERSCCGYLETEHLKTSFLTRIRKEEHLVLFIWELPPPLSVPASARLAENVPTQNETSKSRIISIHDRNRRAKLKLTKF